MLELHFRDSYEDMLDAPSASYRIADNPVARNRFQTVAATHAFDPQSPRASWFPWAVKVGEVLQSYMELGGDLTDVLPDCSDQHDALKPETVFSAALDQCADKAALKGHYRNVIDFLSLTWDQGPVIYDWYESHAAPGRIAKAIPPHFGM